MNVLKQIHSQKLYINAESFCSFSTAHQMPMLFYCIYKCMCTWDLSSPLNIVHTTLTCQPDKVFNLRLVSAYKVIPQLHQLFLTLINIYKLIYKPARSYSCPFCILTITVSIKVIWEDRLIDDWMVVEPANV